MKKTSIVFGRVLALALLTMLTTAKAAITASYPNVTFPAGQVSFVWDAAKNWLLPVPGQGTINFTVSSTTALRDICIGLSPSASRDATNGIFFTLKSGGQNRWGAKQLDSSYLPSGTDCSPEDQNYYYAPMVLPSTTAVDVCITINQPNVIVSARANTGTAANAAAYVQMFSFTLPTTHPAYAPTATTAWKYFSFSGWSNTLSFSNISTASTTPQVATAASTASTSPAVASYPNVISPAGNVSFVWDAAKNWVLPVPGQGTINFTVSSTTALRDVCVGLSPSASQDNTNGVYFDINGWGNTKWIARKLDGTNLPTANTPPTSYSSVVFPPGPVDVQVVVMQPMVTVLARANAGTAANAAAYVQMFSFTLPTTHQAYAPTPTTAWKYFSFSGWSNTLSFSNISTTLATLPPVASYPSVISPAGNVSFVWDAAKNWVLPVPGQGTINFTVSSTTALHDVCIGLSPSATLDATNGIYLDLNGWNNAAWIARTLGGVGLPTASTPPTYYSPVVFPPGPVDVQVVVMQPNVTVLARANTGTAANTAAYVQMFSFTLPTTHPAYAPTATTAWKYFSFSGWSNTLSFSNISTTSAASTTSTTAPVVLPASKAPTASTPPPVASYSIISPAGNVSFVWDAAKNWVLPVPGQGTINFTVLSDPAPYDICVGLSPSASQDNTNGVYFNLNGWNNHAWTIAWIARKLDGTNLPTASTPPTYYSPGAFPPGAVDVQVVVMQPNVTVSARTNRGAVANTAAYVQLFSFTLPTWHPAYAPTATTAWKYFSFSGWNNTLNFYNISTLNN